ncbi:MAG: DUF1549 domain-containing protein, partial [Planctomycetales bacterium]|nr:DUF1549 domain-containing protein [Planctomycetales bacterium]
MACFVAFQTATTAGAAERPVDFSRDVRPILSDRCFGCHGPDATTREADLRLDHKQDVFAKRETGAVVVAGDPEASELIARVTHADVDLRMPPAESNLSLNAAEIELLRRWIQEGATWEEHWAFQPIRRPQPPVSNDGSQWARNPIDQFVFARLQQEGLAPSPPADKETLIRRVTLDLTGLPPS